MAINLDRDTKELAAVYDAVSDMQFASGCKLLERLALKAGDTVLDVGCGTGRLGCRVLAGIGPRGRFIGVDPLAERIRIAREKNGCTNARYRLGVAEDLGFIAAASIDVLYLNWVFHWVADKEAAMREFVRVLRPGGRLGLVLPAKDLASLSTINKVVDTVLAREPYRSFVCAEEAPQKRNNQTISQLVALLIGAGFIVEDVQVKLSEWTYPSASAVMDYLEASYFGNNLDNVPATLRATARAAIMAEFAKYETAAGVRAESWILYAIASKPLVAEEHQSLRPLLCRKKS